MPLTHRPTTAIKLALAHLTELAATNRELIAALDDMEGDLRAIHAAGHDDPAVAHRRLGDLLKRMETFKV